MPSRLDTASDIAGAARELLVSAGAIGRFPTPVDDLVEVAQLKHADADWLSDDFLADIPEALKRKMKLLRGRAVAALDRQEKLIYISEEINHDSRRTFKVLHEVVHEILPWQSDLAFVDDRKTLSWATNLKFEREANQGSADLLFQVDLFTQIAAELQVSSTSIDELRRKFGASIHATFRRFVETHRYPMAGLVLDLEPCTVDPPGYLRGETVESESWSNVWSPLSSWPRVLLGVPFSFIDSIPRARGLVPPRPNLVLADRSGNMAELKCEVFSNQYRAFVLIWDREPAKHRATYPLVADSV